MPHILHLGMPKCLSVPIQHMFAADRGNLYLGMYPSEIVPKQVQYAIETELMQVPSHHYNQTVVQQLFDVAKDTAVETGAEHLVISEDRLFDNFSWGGVSAAERLSRFTKVMPEDTCALMIVRNPIDYLQAYYKDLVINRFLQISFDDFVKYLLVRGSKSFLGLLDYSTHVAVVRDYFKDIEVVMYEQLMEDNELLHTRMKTRGVSIGQPLDCLLDTNVSDAKAVHFQRLAREYSGAGSGHPALTLDVGDVATLAENSPLFESLLMQDAIQKTSCGNILEASGKMEEVDPSARLDFTLDSQIERMLNSYLVKVNQALVQSTALPLGQYGYLLNDENGEEEKSSPGIH